MSLSQSTPPSFPPKSFESLVNQSPLGIFIWKLKPKKDLDSCVNIFVNHSALNMLRVDQKTILNRSVSQAFPGIDQTSISTVFKTLIKTKKPQKIPLFAYGDQKIKSSFFSVDLVLIDSEHVGIFFEDVGKQVLAQNLLKEKVKEAERLNEFMVGREIKMMELKKEIENLKRKKGTPHS